MGSTLTVAQSKDESASYYYCYCCYEYKTTEILVTQDS